MPIYYTLCTFLIAFHMAESEDATKVVFPQKSLISQSVFARTIPSYIYK